MNQHHKPLPPAEPKTKRVHVQGKAIAAGYCRTPVTMNPHQAGTPEFDRWMQDWADGRLQRRLMEWEA